MSRHRAAERRWTRGATCVAALDAALLAAAPAALIGQAITPDVYPSSIVLPSEEPPEPVARGGPIGPAPAVLPTIVPTDAPVWEPSRGRVIVDGRPLPTSSAPVLAAAPGSEAVIEEQPLAAGSPAAPTDHAPLVGVPDVVPPADSGPSTDPEPDPDPIVPVVPEPVDEPSPTSTSAEVQEQQSASAGQTTSEPAP